MRHNRRIARRRNAAMPATASQEHVATLGGRMERAPDPSGHEQAHMRRGGQERAEVGRGRLGRSRRGGTQVVYRIENSHVRARGEDAILHAEHAGGGVPEHHRGELGVVELGTTVSAPRADRPKAGTP